MTLGEIIKEYVDEHSVAQFIKDSGISKAYVYMLINNKNNKGNAITPSIETIKKVAKGVHDSFENVFNRLDNDLLVDIGSDYVQRENIHYHASSRPIANANHIEDIECYGPAPEPKDNPDNYNYHYVQRNISKDEWDLVIKFSALNYIDQKAVLGLVERSLTNPTRLPSIDGQMSLFDMFGDSLSQK
jgi:hypothetical protein